MGCYGLRGGVIFRIVNTMQNQTRDPAVTRIAALYVVCLFVAGLSTLNAFLHANSWPTVAMCVTLALIAVGGLIYCTRRFIRTLV
jgi:protein-S-isoprenylcysteine O-methyltransferase Ste14